MRAIQTEMYSIYFQEKAYKELSAYVLFRNYSKVFILVDENTYTHCYPVFIEKMKIDKPIEVVKIKSGEENKNLKTCYEIWNAVTKLGGDRKSLLITLGGGVITDIGGFVASCFKRGIDFINVPTTLLAMVDAAIGGKTGVNLDTLKNQIGVFSDPQMIIVDDSYLKTLSDYEINSGKAEIIKYGLTHDVSLFNKIKSNLNINKLIFRSIEIKNKIVLEDPKERNLRKVLNFGHTLGHAIESLYLKSEGKKSLSHGEAIAIGMVCESYISNNLMGLSMEKVKEIKEVIKSIYIKINLQEKDFDEILNLIKHDKKNESSKINFVLLKDYEDFKIDCEVPEEIIIESLKYYNI